MRHALRAVGVGARGRIARAGSALRRGGRAYLLAVAREIGVREVGILAVASGAYLVARSLWPAIAVGAALIVGGALVLLMHLSAERSVAEDARRERARRVA